MKPLALHLYPSRLLNESRLERLGTSLSSELDDVQIRLVGRAFDLPPGLRGTDHGYTTDLIEGDLPSVLDRFKVPGRLAWDLNLVRAYWAADVAVVSAHSVWTLPTAWLLAFRHGIPLVYNPHELETRVPTMVGLKGAAARAIEAALIGRADLVTVVNENIRWWYAERYRSVHPVTLYNYPSRDRDSAPIDLRSEFDVPSDVPLYVHTGYLTKGRNISAILDAFSAPDVDAHVVFIGSGEFASSVQSAARSRENIHLAGMVRPDQIINTVAQADAALCLIELDGESYSNCSPNKLFEGLSACVPVVASDFPEARYRLGADSGLVLNDVRAELGRFVARHSKVDLERAASTLRRLDSWEDEVGPVADAYRNILRRRSNSVMDRVGKRVRGLAQASIR